MAEQSKIVWITGAGRSGTNLAGMLIDGHPQVDLFPYEFRVSSLWEDLEKWAASSPDGKLPTNILDKKLVLPFLKKKRFAKLGISAETFAGAPASRQAFIEYVQGVHGRLFIDPKDFFIYRAPGSQIAAFLERAEKENFRDFQLLVMLRHPVQNYLSLVSHYIQKGSGYFSPDHIQPHLGLNSFLHIAMLRVLNAFKAANEFEGHDKVTIVRLEDFSGDKKERDKVWKAIGIPGHEALERLTRAGEKGDYSSGKLRADSVQQVKTDSYQYKLAETEIKVFEQCRSLFESRYPDFLDGVELAAGVSAAETLRQREIGILLSDKNAEDKRRARVRANLVPPWKKSGSLLAYSRSFVRTIRDDVLFYPEAKVNRAGTSYEQALLGFEKLPELYSVLE